MVSLVQSSGLPDFRSLSLSKGSAQEAMPYTNSLSIIRVISVTFPPMADVALKGLQVEISYRQIIRIALPISLAMLVPQVNFITNNVFLGNYSQHALAVASITGVYYLIFSMIGFGLNNGLQTLIARRAGENRPGEIGRIFGQGVFIAFIIAAIGILLTWFVAPLILKSVIRD